MKISFGLFFVLILIACSNPENAADTEKSPGENSTDEESTSQIKKDSVAVFNWDSELCTHKSKYNAHLYTQDELRGTRQLLQMTGGVLLEVNDVAFKPDQIADLSSLSALDAEYQKKKKQLQALKVVNQPYWLKIKKRLTLAMKDEYDLSRINIQAYTNPNVLKGNRFSKFCPDIVTALNSKDTALLMKTWRALVEEQCKNNASPERLMKRFEEESHDPDWMLYARTELITFGWSNRVNDQIEHVKNDEAINNKFEQLFLETHSECDEP